METHKDFTKGKIIGPLFGFAGPILFALFLQAMYGAIDLAVVGQFGTSVDVSAVSTGSQIMSTITYMICAFAMGTTVTLGQKLGEGKAKEGGRIIGASIVLFLVIGLVMTVLVPILAGGLAGLMNAPEEAFSETVAYIRICGVGSIVIIAYNLIGSIFRGLGDSRTPLITVAIACVCNILGDLLFVAVFGMGTKGAAIATVIAQAVSVLISFQIIRRTKLPFEFSRDQIRPDGAITKKVASVGVPLALQDFILGMSFLIILAIVNSLGLVASAGVGVAIKVSSFIMLVPSSFSQAMSAFTAQNYGAKEYKRAVRSLWYAIGTSTILGLALFYLAFFHGDLLVGIFSSDPEVIAAAADYLKAYAIDCIFTCFLFCFTGFFNGIGATKFVMMQGIGAAFLVRIPVAWFMSLQEPVSLFHIGLGIPISTVVQIGLCFCCYFWVLRRKLKAPAGEN
ncbi:MAG: MATE family efflux transporter [Clostridiales bacterium]|nr:MATE family efflux transporter [Clostridiales bacterium]